VPPAPFESSPYALCALADVLASRRVILLEAEVEHRPADHLVGGMTEHRRHTVIHVNEAAVEVDLADPVVCCLDQPAVAFLRILSPCFVTFFPFVDVG
jgi:hypothetical protein